MTNKHSCQTCQMFHLDPTKAKELTFTIDADKPIVPWKDTPLPTPKDRDLEPHVKRSHVSYTTPYSGDMEGWAMHDFIMTVSGEGENERGDWGRSEPSLHCVTYQGPADDAAGQAQFTGKICGRQGTVTIAQWGYCNAEKFTSYFAIIEETATGELKGVKGGGSYEGAAPDKPGSPMRRTMMVQFQ